jgi:acyl-CoA reductase-like NAD-dependent aldehyde dehydrogenase
MDISQFTTILASQTPQFPWPGHWIDGNWQPGRRTGTLKASYNPNTGERLIEVCLERDVCAIAVEHALSAKANLGALGLDRRMDSLRRLRLTLTDYRHEWERILGLEAGKPLWEARRDIESALKYLDWVSEHGHTIMDSLMSPARLGTHNGHVEMLPIGVTAAYLPFSTPLTSFVFYISASLLAGCPLILSTSSHALVSGLFLALIAEKAELPHGALSVIFGNFQGFRQLVADKRVAAVLFTGSREHCDAIRAESRPHVGRQVVLQSGGKNAVIVDASADLDLAIKCVVYGALTTAGQRCTSTSRVFVHKSRSEEFRSALVEAFRQVPIGRTDIYPQKGEQSGPFIGPLYSEKAVEKFLRFQTMAGRESEKILLWGKALESENRGYFVTPSLHYLTRFDNSTAYQGNVLFSPDVAIYDFDKFETAALEINTTDAAFAVSFVGDPEIIAKERHLLLAPNILVNVPTVEIEATLPLAGRLQSGHHRFHGPGIALYLCYPQVLSQSAETTALMRSWPWPGLSSR